MNEIELIKNLKGIEIKPDPKWQEMTLRLLKIEVNNSLNFNNRNLFYFLNHNIMGAIVAVIVAVLLAGGTAFASDSARPGDLLYPVDTFMEQLQRGLTTDPISLAELELNFMQERVMEMKQLQEGENFEGFKASLGELEMQQNRIQERIAALNQLREENKLQTSEQQQIMQKLGEQLQEQLGAMTQVQQQLQAENSNESNEMQQELQQFQNAFQNNMQQSYQEFQNDTGVQLEFDFQQQQQNSGEEDQLQNQNQNTNQINNGSDSGDSNQNGGNGNN